MLKLNGYLASHFFNLFGYEGTERLAKVLEEKTHVKWYVPHRNGEINDKKNNDATITDKAIYRADTEELKKADIIVACLDGESIDDGVCTEIGFVAGYMEALNMYGIPHRPKIIIGLYTDMRQFGTGDNHHYINLYTKGAVNVWGKIVNNVDDLIEEITNYCENVIQI